MPALIGLVIFFALFITIATIATKRQLAAHQEQLKQQERAANFAMQLNPVYREKVEEDRRYTLAQEQLRLQQQELALKQERQAAELALERDRFRLEIWKTRTLITPETYLLDYQPQAVTPLPSLRALPPEKALAQAMPAQLPPAYDLLDIFKTADITPDRIFLAKGQDGQALFIRAAQLHHAAFSASTGYGKTTLERGIMTQLLYIGHHVVLADLKYADVTEKGEDWRPLAARMFEQPPLEIGSGYRLPNIVRKEDQIAILLHWMAYTEMERRLEMRARRDFSYPTLDVFLEELVALTVAYPGVTKDILRIISLGRELRLNLFTTAQNMQVSSIGLSGGAREQFTTAWFLGGDEISAAALLDMPRKELTDFLRGNNIILGQGIGMMRNNYVMPSAGVVRLGLTSNESVYHILGKADHFELPTVEAFNARRSYSVPGTPERAGMIEYTTPATRNGQERDTEPTGTVFSGVPATGDQDDMSPFLVFSEEQRTAILEAAKKPNMSLRKIRTAAKINNSSRHFAAMKLWLQMNGYSFEAQKERVEA